MGTAGCAVLLLNAYRSCEIRCSSMREAEFRRSLTGRLNEKSVDSYVAYCRRVESELNINLDACDLSPLGLPSVVQQLRRMGIAENSVRNCTSAMRAYARLDSDTLHRSNTQTRRDNQLRDQPNRIHAKTLSSQASKHYAQPQNALILQSSVAELLEIYGDVMDELRRRGVVRTGNSPVGDYAEFLFAKAFNWSLEENSASGHDATDTQGRRYQIKGRRIPNLAASRQLSAIRKINEHTFDFLAAVLFDASFKVFRAILIPHALVQARARRSEHTNSWIFFLDDKLWREPGIRDVTAELSVAASRI